MTTIPNTDSKLLTAERVAETFGFTSHGKKPFVHLPHTARIRDPIAQERLPQTRSPLRPELIAAG